MKTQSMGTQIVVLQMSRLTEEKGCLSFDDRIDALASLLRSLSKPRPKIR